MKIIKSSAGEPEFGIVGIDVAPNLTKRHPATSQDISICRRQGVFRDWDADQSGQYLKDGEKSHVELYDNMRVSINGGSPKMMVFLGL